ncbi:hypothetical protein D3P07_16825 [Paenibacillus sp. 1011MAR3C5]|uniref:hypothetical protein n=1 Tax=Paenibacillus sp. 1011MAR3C5 TaxID=1675787 RepID=UPI000E6C6247|nr:hypothetical protein [Paenibacillus sp. 1011MAR3C5]RJE86849.1 hypothetical protein D3P07_16825 [Paenibacillus sp. 1011MAR3C5]
MDRHSLFERLKPVRRRMTLFRLLRLGLLGLFAGSIAGALVLSAARLWPLLYASILSSTFVLVGLIAGIGIGIWRRASDKEAAKEMDKSVTEDAIVTALDGLGAYREDKDEPIIVTLQREEATQAAARYVSELNKRLPWPSWRSVRPLLYGLAAVWAVIVLLLLIPNPLYELAEAQAEARSSIAELEQEVQGLEEELEKLELPQDAKKELVKSLDELRKELASSGMKPAEALEKLAEAMRELERAADAAKDAVQRLDTAAEAMSGEPQLRPLGAALQDRDSAAVQQAVEDIRSSLKRLAPAERERLADALEKLAAQLDQGQGANASELASAFVEAAKQVRGNGGEASPESGDALSGLMDELGRELSQGELEQLARAMSGQLGRSGDAIAEGMRSQGAGSSIPSSWGGAVSSGTGTDGAVSSGSGTTDGGLNSGQGSGSSPGSGNGAGNSGSQEKGSATDTGSGAGAGSGTGSGGSQGTGSGTGSGSGTGAGSGQGTGSGAGSGSGQGSGAGLGAGSRTLITTPRAMAGTGDVYEDGGPSTGGRIEQGGQSPMIDGLTRPYDEVYNEYAAEAKQSLGRSALPASMQDKVKQYFDEIQPNR